MFPCVSGCIHSIVHTQRSEDNLRSQTSLSILFETVSLLGGHSVCRLAVSRVSWDSPICLPSHWRSDGLAKASCYRVNLYVSYRVQTQFVTLVQQALPTEQSLQP